MSYDNWAEAGLVACTAAGEYAAGHAVTNETAVGHRTSPFARQPGDGVKASQSVRKTRSG